MFASKDTLLTRPSGYNIARSVRTRSSASGYFSRVQGSATSTTTGTWSGWCKRGKLGVRQYIWSSSNVDFVRFDSADTITITYLSNLGYVSTTALYRDPSAWYHIVLVFDTTNATAANRLRLFVNGVAQTLNWGATPQTQNATFQRWNVSGYTGDIADFQYDHTDNFDGYMADSYWIDGQALTPSSFGETDSITGVWKAKKYGGTYGTNGFYLNFSDNSNNTAATIGKDYSGNGNNWTPNNISVTAGVTYDSMQDVPTLTSATAANYAVWNPLKATAGTYSSANLGVVRSGAVNVDLPISTLQIPKTVPIYCEISFGNQDSSYGIAKDTSNSGANGIVGSSSDGASYGAYVTTDSTYYGFWNNNSRTSFNFSGGTIYQMAFDQANGKLWFGKDNTWYNSGNPTNGTNPTFSSISTTTDFFVAALASTSAASVNFGQRPFSYTPPTGFVALNTYNLPASTITNGAAYMAATTYTGNVTARNISNAVNGVSFQPDFVWLKNRTTAYGHVLQDSIRGTSVYLASNSSAVETAASLVTAFNSDGFAVSTSNVVNENSAGIVGWQWKAGTTSASNTNGTITSTVSAGATQGFSVVTYTGTGANATVGHGLGVAPQMIIVKCRSNASTNWTVYHTSLGNTGYIYLNLTNAAGTGYSGFWNNTSPTSSVFSLGSDVDGYVNGSGRTNVAYCFASVAGFSSVGSYTGNGSTDGPMIYLGFKPRWFMSKRSDTAGNDWVIMDTSRDTYNVAQKQLYADLSNAEEVNSVYDTDFLSNGLKIRTSTASRNASGSTYIYIAFAEVPFKTSLAR